MLRSSWTWRLVAPSAVGYLSFFNVYLAVGGAAAAAWATWRWQ